MRMATHLRDTTRHVATLLKGEIASPSEIGAPGAHLDFDRPLLLLDLCSRRGVAWSP